MFHCVHGTAPEYNVSLVQQYTPARQLRSSDSISYVVPKVHTKWGDRSFVHVGPLLWNKLPADIKETHNINIFKVKLKSHLFNLAYK